MRVTYYGQACTAIEIAGRTIVTDPWLTEGAYFGTWFHTHLLSDAHVSAATLAGRKIDYLFLSHEHPDHVDPATLRALPPDVPVLICKFPTPRFRMHLESIGLTNIRELESGETTDLGEGLNVTVYRSADYINDSALLVEGEGCRLFNETDCKLPFEVVERIGAKGIDIGFFMFSGATWWPMMYDYPPDAMRQHVKRRRAALLKSFVQRVKFTRPRFAVPSAGPCTILDPERLWLNDPESGTFIDPEEAISALSAAGLPAEPLYMMVGDVWDSRTGLERRSSRPEPPNRREYIADVSQRLAPTMERWRAEEPPARSDLGERISRYFESRVGALSMEMRRRIGAKVGIVAHGKMDGAWTIDFESSDSTFVREGLAKDWTYKIDVEDKLLYPFVSGAHEFFEDLFLSLRCRLARRPDRYNDPLYNFFYDPNPRRLEDWYGAHRSAD
jgi:Beta-lactamase superfamily domain